MVKILQNALRITPPQGEPFFLVSLSRHHFNAFEFPDGGLIAVDGGKEYLRRVGKVGTTTSEGYLVEDFSLEETDDFELICERLLWGSFGKDGKGPCKFVLFKNCETEHLQNILKYPFPEGRTLSELQVKVINSILAKRA